MFIYFSATTRCKLTVIVTIITDEGNMTSLGIRDATIATIGDTFNETDTDDSTTIISEVPELDTTITGNENTTSMKVAGMPLATIAQEMNATDAEDSKRTTTAGLI